MQITNIRVVSVSGGNRAPSSGDVWFDDGKVYGWSTHGGTITFFTSKKLSVGKTTMSFSSPKRAALLVEYLNTRPWTVHVIRVSMD